MNARQFVCAALALLCAATLTFAMPPVGGGPSPDFPPGVNQPTARALERDNADYEGEWNLLIILVDFDDYPWDNQNDDNFPNDGAPYGPS